MTASFAFSLSPTGRALLHRAITAALDSQTYLPEQTELEATYDRLQWARPRLDEDTMLLLESVIEFASESEAFLSQDAELDRLYRRLQAARRRLART